MKSKNLIIGILILTIITIVLQSNFVISAGQSTVCAQYTKYGASCQNVPADQADTSNGYQIWQSSCQSTDICQKGICVSSQGGSCTPNSPQATCNSSGGGIWYSSSNPSDVSTVPICQSGCCFIGDQVSFTTQARCKSFSTSYGINTTFDKSINDPLVCAASAYPQAKGACVYDPSNGRTCKFTTRQDCKKISSSTFRQDFLCTNPDLGTNCAIQQKTTCIKTSSSVYFTDSCGNQANIYNANKINDIKYWSYVADSEIGKQNGVTVDIGDGSNTESSTNGYCSYSNESICRPYDKNIDTAAPTYGNNICRSVNCNSPTNLWGQLFKSTYGRTPANGESWCGLETATSVSLTKGNQGASGDFSNYNKAGNVPGSTEVLFTCTNGQITNQLEPDGPYRNKICVQNVTSNGRVSAGFIANRWADCFIQNSSKECKNTVLRDCQWIVGASTSKDDLGNPLVWDQGQDLLVPRNDQKQPLGDTIFDTRSEASCVPKYPAAFDTTTTNTCGVASRVCYVNYTQAPQESITSFWRVDTSNEGVFNAGSDGRISPAWITPRITCLGDYNDNNGGKPSINSDWQKRLSNLCQAQGDCGISVNYVNTQGANAINDIFSVVMGNSTGTKIG